MHLPILEKSLRRITDIELAELSDVKKKKKEVQIKSCSLWQLTFISAHRLTLYFINTPRKYMIEYENMILSHVQEKLEKARTVK